MISSVSSSLQAMSELPVPPSDGPAGAAGAARCAVPARATAAELPAGPARAAAKPKPTPRKTRPAVPGYAKPVATAKTGTSKKPGPLSFLDDPRLSVEDKLLRLLAYLNDKWDKDLQKKMKELRTKEEGASGTSGSSASKKSSGLGSALSKIVNIAKDQFPQVGITLAALKDPGLRSVISGFAGPALAALVTSMGLPQLAPAALALGPKLVDEAAGLAADLAEDGAAGSSKASGSSTGSSEKEDASPLGSDRQAQLKLMEMQRIMDQQKEMFGLVSNMLRSGHDLRMAVIQNIR